MAAGVVPCDTSGLLPGAAGVEVVTDDTAGGEGDSHRSSQCRRHAITATTSSASSVAALHHTGALESANGSCSVRRAVGGTFAVCDSEPPSRVLIRMRPLMAQPLASRSGPRLRWRNLSQAMSMLGPEMASMMPIRPSGIQTPRSTNLAKRPTATALILPRATPSAATVPTSVRRGCEEFPLSIVGLTALRSVFASELAVVPSDFCARASPAAARLATCSSIRRTNFL